MPGDVADILTSPSGCPFLFDAYVPMGLGDYLIQVIPPEGNCGNERDFH